jgi:sulfoquinovosidase
MPTRTYGVKGMPDRFRLEDLVIHVARGRARYRMNRGTFKTKDKIKDKKRLFFTHREDNRYVFKNKDVILEIDVTENSGKRTLSLRLNDDSNRIWISFAADPNEHIYGCGEQFGFFDLKGKKVDIWVSEHHSLKKLLSKFLFEKLFGVHPKRTGTYRNHRTYYAQPSFLSSTRMFCHVDSTAFQTFSFEKKETTLHIREIPKKITFLSADDFLSLSEKVSDLLGKQPPLPAWTEKGAIIASQGGTERLLENVSIAEKNGIPLSAVWSQDWSGQLITAFGSQVFWNWQVDEKLYPDLKKTILDLRSKGIRFLGYINTFLKEDSALYVEAENKGYLVKNEKGDVYPIKSTTFKAGIVDLTNPAAYAWYKSIIKTNMIDLGMSGWMADFGEYLPTDAIVSGGNAETLHNTWPVLWAKLNHEAISETKTRDLFFFTRAGFTKSIPYIHSMWAGDQHVDFSYRDGLASAITSMLSMSVTGIGLTHSDIGGYTTIFHMKRDKELFMRWTEMNVFTPLFRCHEGNKPEVNVQFSHDLETLEHFRTMADYFSHLSPYLKDMKAIYQEKGIPVNRPLFFHFDEQEAYTCMHQFMYGSDLLIAPVIDRKTRAMDVYLPKGSWVQLFTEKTFTGGKIHIETPLGRPIAFYREDSSYRSLFADIRHLEKESAI